MRRLLRCRKGFTLIELLMVATIVTGAGEISVYMQAKKRASAMQCANRLKQIQLFLTYYEMDEGKLPEAAFYPKNPESGSDSIRVILKKYGAPKDVFICAAAPPKLREKGLTYLWNDACSGKASERIPNGSTTWLMVEVHALGRVSLEGLSSEERSRVPERLLRQIPAPHGGKYNVLYADGHIAQVKEPPKLAPEKKRKK